MLPREAAESLLFRNSQDSNGQRPEEASVSSFLTLLQAESWTTETPKVPVV